MERKTLELHRLHLERDVAAFTEEKEHLQAELSRLKTTESELRQKLGDTQAEFGETVTRLGRDKAELESEIAAAKAELSSRSNDLEELNAQIESYRKQSTELQGEIGALRSNAAYHHDRIEQLLKSQKEQEAALREVRSELSSCDFRQWEFCDKQCSEKVGHARLASKCTPVEGSNDPSCLCRLQSVNTLRRTGN